MNRINHRDGEGYQSIFENATEGIFQSSIEGSFLRVNPAMAHIFGYESPEDMVKSVANIAESIHVDEGTRIQFVEKLINHGRVVGYEARNYRKDKSVIWTRTNARTVHDEKGNILYFEGFLTDITSHKEAEIALLESEEKYRALVERLPGAVFLDRSDDPEKTLFISPKIEDLLGYSQGEWISQVSWSDIIHPEDRKRVLNASKRADETGELFRQEYRMRNKAGDYVWIREESSLVKDDDGQPLFWQGFFLDISDQKQAESAIIQSEEQFKKVFQSNPIAAFIATLDEERFIAANEAYWKLTGFKPDGFLGHTSIDLGFRSNEKREKLITRLKKEKTIRNESGKLITRSGKICNTLEFYELITFNEQACILAMFYDMTDQVKAQQALQENEEKYRQLFEAESDAIFLIDNERGDILETNAAAAAMYGYSKEELLLKKNSDLSAEPEATRQVTQTTPIVKDRVVTIPLRYHRKKDGTVFPIEITGRFFEWRGRPVHIAAIRDITERMRVEEALRESEQNFRNIVEHTTNIYYSHTPDHVLTFMSPQTHEILGYEQNEALVNWHELLTDNPINKNGIELTQQAIDTGKRQKAYELELKRKDGRSVWVEVHESPVLQDGKTIAIVGALTDITERKRAEEIFTHQLEELTILHNIAIAASSSRTLDELIKRATDTLYSTLHPDNCGVELVTEDGKAYQTHHSYRGTSSSEPRNLMPLSKGVTGKVISTGIPIRLGDVTKEPAYIEATKGVRSELCVPIKIQERIIGVFNIESKQVNAYSESDERLLNTIAGTLATAIEQLRLFETSQRRLKELTILNRVTIAITGAASVDELIEVVTQIIGESLYPDNFGVLLLNDEGTLLTPHSSYRGISVGKFPSSFSLEKGVCAQVAASGQPLRIANVRNYRNYIEVTSQVRSELCVPIAHGDRILGVINAESLIINFFTEDDERLLVTIASTLATAIEKLRLHEAEKKRRHETEILLEATTTLTTSLNMDILLDTILEILFKIVPYDSASIALDQEGKLFLAAGRGFPPAYEVTGKQLPYSEKWLLLSTTQKPFIIPDTQLEPKFEQWQGSEYIRAWMGVPLVVHGKLKGFFNLDSRKPNAFTENDAILAQTFANSAAVAIENARLFEGEQQSRQKAEALRETTASLTASIELDTLYETILDSLTKLIPFDSASIEIMENGMTKVVAGRGLKENQGCMNQQYPCDATKWGDLKELREPVIIPDVQDDDRFIKFEGTSYIRGWMGVPMFVQDKLVGFLNLDSSVRGFFTRDHAALAQTFGNQAAVAIENARLFEAEQKRRREAEILRRASSALTSSLELNEVLNILLEQIAILIPYNSAAVFLQDKDHYKVVAGKGFTQPEKVIGQKFPFDDKLSSKVRETRQAIISGDIQKDPRFQKWGDADDIHGWMCFPLIVRDRVIGHLTIDSYEINAYNESDAELAMAFANQAATALENARLFEAEQRRLRESETLRTAAVAISTSLELESVLETILIVMKPVLPYDSASILLLEGQELCLTAAQGLSNMGVITNYKFSAANELFNAVRTSGEPLIIKNAQRDRRFKKWGNTGYVRGWMGVPLVLRGEVIGCITFDCVQEDMYSDSHASLAQTFANQAALAIQNARQFETEQRHFQEAETLRQAAEAITSTLEIQQVLNSILENLNRVVPFDSAGVFLIDNDQVRLTAYKGMLNRANITGQLFSAKNELLFQIWQTGMPLILKDAQNDPRYEKWVVDSTRGWMGVPLIARGNIIGYITIDSFLVDAYNEHDANLAMTFAHQAAVAIENARLYERGEQQIRQLTVLRDIDSAISSSFDLRITLNLLIGYAARELNADAVAILLYNPDLKSLYLYTTSGFINKQPNFAPHIRIGEGPTGHVVLQRKIIQITDLATETEFPQTPYTIGESFKSYFGIPLISKGQIKGVMEIFTRKVYNPDSDWLNFLQTLAGQAAIAIDNVQMFRNLQRSNQELVLAYDTTLAGWGRALELRDKETQGHTDRVVELTLELARRMGIEGEELTHIMRGTLLHDIGKMGIPDHILHKPGPLTEEEWVIMRQHPQYAYDLMNPIPYLRQSLDIPFAHHERWDGSGYPRGLKGEEIPLAARIFAVVDIWDALLYDRVYRDAWPEEKVIDYLKNTAGIELDPTIVEKFLELIEKQRNKNQAE